EFIATHLFVLTGSVCSAIPLEKSFSTLGLFVFFYYKTKVFGGWITKEGLIDPQLACFISGHTPMHIGDQIFTR
ncbi:MAG: hypothetical protein NTX97_13360, partial [Bacteroidetes bacterium]|nr:hypothetical protein [Bacteroidota bacterium]